MALTDETESTTTIAAVMTVRIPNESGSDLVTAAQQRLSRVEGIRTVTIDEMRGLEPGVSATHVTVAVSIESGVGVDDLRERLAATIAVEDITRLVAR